MEIETNGGTARVTKERITLSQYKAMLAVHNEAKELSNARIWTVLRSILHEIELSSAPYASTIEDARKAMAENDAISTMSYHLAMGCEIVPDNQLALPLEPGA